MISWVDKWEEVNATPESTAQEVDQVTVRSGHQLQLLELWERVVERNDTRRTTNITKC